MDVWMCGVFAGANAQDLTALSKGDVYAFGVMLLQLCSVAPVHIGECRNFDSLDEARSFKLLTMIARGSRKCGLFASVVVHWCVGVLLAIRHHVRVTSAWLVHYVRCRTR